MSTDRRSRRALPRFRLPLWALAIIGAVALFLAIAFLWWSSVQLYGFVVGLVADGDVNEPAPLQLEEPAADEGQLAAPVQIDPGAPPLEALSPAALEPWSGQERVNVLLLGIDLRCDVTGPTHTDTMMVASIDPTGRSASVLSLPRDLWVEIPGHGVDRINQAYYLGAAFEYPGGPQALAMQTVAALLGVPIEHYVAINFQAFVDFVNMIDGIDLEVPETIDDRTYPDHCYGYEPFYLEEGPQHLDGSTALKYARTRATAQGDIDRANRQQAVILAIREKVLKVGMVAELITQAPRLWQTLRTNVSTNLQLEEIIRLALLAQEIPAENIQQAVLGYQYVYNQTTPDGRQVLVPNREQVRALRDRLFAPAAVPTPEVEQLPALMVEEAARVAIYNGTPTFQLAGRTQTYLRSLSVNVTEIGNADFNDYQASQIIDYGEHPHTVLFLQQTMGIPPLNVSSGRNPSGDFDLLVIIGSNWEIPGEEEVRATNSE